MVQGEGQEKLESAGRDSVDPDVKRLLSDNKNASASSDGRQLLTEAEYHEALRIENEVLKRTLAQVHMAAGYKRGEESSSGGEDTA